MNDETIETKAVELWALEKGHCAYRAGSHGQRVPTLDVERADHFITDLWKFRAAQFHFKWEAGQALTEAEYLDAIKTVENI